MAQNKRFKLPGNLAEWRQQRKALNSDNVDIHTLKAPNSASELKHEQFLTFKAIWADQKQTQMEKYLKEIGFSQQVFDDTTLAMKKRVGWTLYLDAIKANKDATADGRPRPWTQYSNFPESFGVYSVVLQDQLVILDLDEDPAHTDSTKVAVTPKPRRDNKFVEKLRLVKPKQSYQDANETPRQMSLFDALVVISANKNDYEGKFEDAKDEQIVNCALVNLLKALWIHEDRNSEWTVERKEFKFLSQGTGAGFIARTDGHLQVGNKSAAILEVKARARPRNDLVDHKIQMQESAQMALWIAQEPQSHWASAGSKGKQTETRFHRVLISQDRHQIFLTIAEYPQKYIDYLHAKNGVRINDTDFALHMKVFGEFDTRDSAQMHLLGVLVRVILTHAANAIRMASRMDDLGQALAETSLSKGKGRARDDDHQSEMWRPRRLSVGEGTASSESHSASRPNTPCPDPVDRARRQERAREDPRADTLTPGRPSIGERTASSHSSFRTHSPAPGPLGKGRNVPAANPQGRR